MLFIGIYSSNEVSRHMTQIQNWSGSVRFTPKNLHTPETEAALIALVKACSQQNRRIRVIGSGHSFTRLIETDDVLISLNKLQGIINVDHDTHQVTVWGGTKIKALGKHLAAVDLAQINLGDIDVQSIAGAISTGTHGSGAALGSVATQVVGLRLITASGAVIDCSETENRDIFKAAQVSMGTLGIITQVTLQCMPAYTLDYHWYKQPLQDVLHNLDKLKQHRHFEFYWIPHTETTLVKTMNIIDQPAQHKSLFRRFNENVIENLAFWGFSAAAWQFPWQSKRIARMMSTLISNGHDVTASHETFATVRVVKF
ncbi:MAG: FAD-binding protein [Chloroflexi bacterium AL-W]|nr:FAD-binding protein [Chloroflexi bacterium AL-N1]NOK71614.1 FAD-binding protein [Chloroflexi bacterium AL-N10]NOK78914.1 FAD-binding protein [Chloroflexi bacterium AL-N5]NOK86389.1 FAD-binding protein [Chloroflexi bacterium AL-W]